MELSAVLFDMDGVLIDTDDAIADLWNALAAELGLAISPADFAAHVYGCSPEHTIETVFSPLSPQDRAKVLRRVREAEPGLAFSPVPHAADLVRHLADANVPLALVTGASADRAAHALETLGLSDLFTTAVTWGEATRGKPAPDCYLLAADRLGVTPQTCLVFEDTTGGVAAAVAAGATCVALSRLDPQPLRVAGARHVVRDFGAVRLREHGTRTVLGVAEQEAFTLRPAAERFPAPSKTENRAEAEGGSPWR
ncbi:HAD family hydrolase [Streptomyces sp. NPDC091217]|uniref:HAD family hydrolase n=1 Tax=Streptomyces sp. NPDC091217 TaxID=3365975 RepID=UPI0037FC5E06